MSDNITYHTDNSASSLINTLNDFNVKMWLDRGVLRYKSPPGVMTPELIKKIKENKIDIIRFLQSLESSNHVPQLELVKSNGSKEVFPATCMQQSIWYLSSLNKKSNEYNITIKITIYHSIDKEKIVSSCRQLVDRHEALRTSFYEEGGILYQKIHQHPLLNIQFHDSECLLDNEIDVYCDLSQEVVTRFNVVEVESDKTYVYISCHHIVSDGASMEIIYKDFISIYTATDLPVCVYQYKDFSVSYDRYIKSGSVDDGLLHWVSLLDGDVPTLSFPRHVNCSPSGVSNERNYYINIDHHAMNRLSVILKSNPSITSFSVFLAAYIIFLHRYTNQADIIVGIPVSIRFSSDLDRTVGMFANSLPVRYTFAHDTSALDVINSVANQVVDANTYSLTPLSLIIDQLNLPRDQSATTLFQTMFTMDSNLKEPDEINSLFSYDACDLNTSKFPISLYVRQESDFCQCLFEHDPDLIDRSMIEQAASHYVNLFCSIVSNPAQRSHELSLLTESERRFLIFGWNETAAEFNKNIMIHQLFEAIVDESPDNVAVSCDSQSITYLQLNEKSNLLANHLLCNGVNPGDTVAILLDRSIDAVISFLAVLKFGGVFVPIDYSYPNERIKYILNDANCRCVISKTTFSQNITNESCNFLNLDSEIIEYSKTKANNLNIEINMDDLAYIIYTSGSTGNPKGVMIHHLGISHYIQWACKFYRVSKGVGAPVHSSLAFDLTITSIFCPLSVGKTIFMIPDKYGLKGLVQSLEDRQDYSLIKITPAHLRLIQPMLDKELLAKMHACVVIGGESLFYEDISMWFSVAKSMRFINEYGATETSVADTIYELTSCVPDTKTIPVGRAIDNSQMYVLDEHMNPVPYGVMGEIYLSGVGLAKGYLNLPLKTDEKFLAHPFINDQKIYKTGDYGRIFSDGNVEFISRVDGQVKVQGYRVELGEVQCALDSYSAIDKSVAHVKKNNKNENYILAYYVCDNESLSSYDLRMFLKDKIPAYMIPSCFIKLDELPLTVNGKIDFSSLPDPCPEDFVIKSDFLNPSTEKEIILVELWKTILNIDQISVNDSFYALGGDSIDSITLISRLKKTGWDVTILDVLNNQTIRELAQTMRRSVEKCHRNNAITSANCPLSPAQSWFINNHFHNIDYFNQSHLFILEKDINYCELNNAYKKVLMHHDSFFLTLGEDKKQYYLKQDSRVYPDLELFSCPKLSITEQLLWIQQAVNSRQSHLSLRHGPLNRMLMFEGCEDGKNRFAWIIHHWIIDTVSWNILLDDLASLLSDDQLSPKSSPYNVWVKQLNVQKVLVDDAEFCRVNYSDRDSYIYDNLDRFPISRYVNFQCELDLKVSNALIRLCKNKTPIALDRLIMSVVFNFISNILQVKELLIDVETHGRDLVSYIDVTNTVGWFTNIYPVKFCANDDIISALNSLDQSIKIAASKSLSFALSQYNNSSAPNSRRSFAGFNFLGNQSLSNRSIFTSSNEIAHNEIDPMNHAWHVLDIVSWLDNACIKFNIIQHPDLLDQKTMINFKSMLNNEFEKLINVLEVGCSVNGTLLVDRKKYFSTPVRYAIPATETQCLMHFHSSGSHGSDYLTQMILPYDDFNVNIEDIWKKIMYAFPVLSSSFIKNEHDELVQIIGNCEKFHFCEHDFSEVSASVADEYIDDLLDCDMSFGFDLSSASTLFRIFIIKLAGGVGKCVWSYHHILLDGWSTVSVLRLWHKLLGNDLTEQLKPDVSFFYYAQYRGNQDDGDNITYWRNRLDGACKTLLIKKERIIDTSFCSKKFKIGCKLTAEVESFCLKNSLKPNVLFQFSWSLVVALYADNLDVIFDIITSGRTSGFPSIEDVVGLTMNIIPCRVVLANKDKLLDKLLSCQKAFNLDNAHDNVRLSNLSAKESVQCDKYCDSLFVFENYKSANIISSNDVECRSRTPYPVVLAILPGSNITLAFDYKPEYFASNEIDFFSSAMKVVVELIIYGDSKQTVGDVMRSISLIK